MMSVAVSAGACKMDARLGPYKADTFVRTLTPHAKEFGKLPHDRLYGWFFGLQLAGSGTAVLEHRADVSGAWPPSGPS